VKYTVARGVYHFLLFFWNGKSHLSHNASTDVDFLKEVPFGDIKLCKEMFRGHICPSIIENNLTIAQT
jgi:hypothetical protein